MTARVSMLLKSRIFPDMLLSLFLSGRAKDLSAPRYIYIAFSLMRVTILEYDAM